MFTINETPILDPQSSDSNIIIPDFVKPVEASEAENALLYKNQLEFDLSMQRLSLPRVCIVNAIFDLNCTINLKELALHSRNVTYRPTRNQSLFMTLYQPKTQCVVHSSGKIMVMGATNEQDALLACKLHARNIYKMHTCWSTVNKKGTKPRFSDYHVNHIFGNANLKRRVRIDALAAEYSQYATYNPYIHSAVKINLNFPKSTVMLHRTGKMAISGIKTQLDLLQVFQVIVCLSKPFWMD